MAPLLSITLCVVEAFLLTWVAELLDGLQEPEEQRVVCTDPSSSVQTERRERRYGVPGSHRSGSCIGYALQFTAPAPLVLE